MLYQAFFDLKVLIKQTVCWITNYLILYSSSLSFVCKFSQKLHNASLKKIAQCVKRT